MKVVQKILSHGLLITFFVVVFFLYLYRAALFPQWFGDSAETSAKTEVTPAPESRTSPVVSPGEMRDEPEGNVIGARAIAVQSPSASSTAIAPAQDDSGLPPLVMDDEAVPAAGNLPPRVTDDQAAPTFEEAAPAPPAEAVAVPAEQMPSVADHPPAVAAQSSGPDPESQSSAPAEPVQADVVAPSDGALAPAQQSAAQPDSMSGSASTVDDYQSQLLVARELYWKRDAEGAVNAYTQMLQSYPDQAGGWGELGNLYMAFGQKENAADAYSQAISLFIKQDRREEASNMLGVMGTLDPVKAEEFRQRLETAER